MSLLEFSFLAFGSLFVIVDPIGLIPAFLGMTPNDSAAVRERMARLACILATIVLLVFAAAGQWIFKLLGLTMPAFQIAGSLVLMLIAIDMIRARPSRVTQADEDTDAGLEKDDIAITPLAVPMLAGPGAISNSLILMNQAEDWTRKGIVLASIPAVCLASYVIFRLAVHGAKWLSPIVMRVLTRLMGLLVAAIAVQFLLDALAELGLVSA